MASLFIRKKEFLARLENEPIGVLKTVSPEKADIFRRLPKHFGLLATAVFDSGLPQTLVLHLRVKMFNTELLSDRLARAKLESRRNREAERRVRIFDDKLRTTGVDKEALDAQVEEKKKREEEAKEEEKTYDAEVLQNVRAACILHHRQEREKRAVEKEVATFRQQQQQPWQRREYDLNDPDLCKKTDHDDAQMILPGLVGEDPDSKSRLQRQKQQLGDWLIQQQTERDAERHRQMLEDQLYDESEEKIKSETLRLQRLETERRKAAAVATKDYNLAQIEEKRRHECGRDDQDGHVRGRQDGEATAAGVGPPGLRRPVDRRPTPESPQLVTRFQKYQMEERRRAESERKQEEDRHDRAVLVAARTALLAERQRAQQNKQLRRELDGANAQLAQTHKQQNPVVEKGAIDESFYSKFNTCSR